MPKKIDIRQTQQTKLTKRRTAMKITITKENSWGQTEIYCEWFTCPICGFDYIKKGFHYCPGCGIEIEFDM